MMENFKSKKIAVLMGGLSHEREISLRSGKAMSQALTALGYQVTELDVEGRLYEQLKNEKIEVAVIALHGRFGEDGTVQGLLELMKIPYTGSGVLGSALAMDKEMAKKIVQGAGPSLGIQTPKTLPKEISSSFISPMIFPLVVKPNSEGSTLGMSLVKEEKDLQPAIQKALEHDENILIEEFISGTEITVAVLNGTSLPVLEIVPRGGFYDYAAKYTRGMTEYIVPARIRQEVQERVLRGSEKIFSLLRLSGVARMDFIVAGEKGIYFLEANTIPGMTETSLVPKAAAAAGISFESLCEEILKSASLKTQTRRLS